MNRCCLAAAWGFACLLPLFAIAEEPEAAPRPSRAELEQQFAATMSHATMVGRFTNSADPEPKEGLKEEKYTLGEVRKLKGDEWLFETRIQYGEHDVKVPLRLAVQWADDTPVITLTNLEIPGMGKFTARVLVYRDHYAGYWDAGDHGGHLFGKILSRKPEAEEKK